MLPEKIRWLFPFADSKGHMEFNITVQIQRFKMGEPCPRAY